MRILPPACLMALCVTTVSLRAQDSLDLTHLPVRMTEQGAIQFVRTYCVECHQSDAPEAGLSLDEFTSKDDVASAIKSWNKLVDRVHAGQMPPLEGETPPMELREAFVKWVRTTIHQSVCDDGIAPGAPIVRRMNGTEYANTVRDLLSIHVNAGHALPVDGAGGEGFDNASETLFISPIHAEKYLDAARVALGHALKDPRARRRIITTEPSAERTPIDAARDVLNEFLPKAFRRPVSSTELDSYLRLFDLAYAAEPGFESALRLTLEAALVSPKFLFLWEQPNDQDVPTLVSQHEMASRLSYFLWASMPDDELRRLADEGRLHEKGVLAQQVARMLQSKINSRGLRRGAKVRDFAASFIEQWLGTRALGREVKPDSSIAGRYDSELEGGMKYEPIFFFEDLLADNRSLLNLIDSDFTYVNRRLARHYGIRGKFREQPKRVELPEDSHRGGVLGMSAVLAVSSFPHRTSPVLRGKWVLETLLGTPPPPPPPDVPELDESTSAGNPTTLRELLELHRASVACASCHATMDPIGFGLENFDVLGRWRTDVDGIPVNARGELPDGTIFEGADELRQLLLARKRQFLRNLTTKMLGYALGRGLDNEDQCAVELIVERVEQDDYKAQALILEIVNSIPFRYKQGNQPSASAVANAEDLQASAKDVTDAP